MFYYWKIREGFIVTTRNSGNEGFNLKCSLHPISGEGKAGWWHHWYVFCWFPLKKNHFPDLMGRIQFELADKKLRKLNTHNNRVHHQQLHGYESVEDIPTQAFWKFQYRSHLVPDTRYMSWPAKNHEILRLRPLMANHTNGIYSRRLYLVFFTNDRDLVFIFMLVIFTGNCHCSSHWAHIVSASAEFCRLNLITESVHPSEVLPSSAFCGRLATNR